MEPDCIVSSQEAILLPNTMSTQCSVLPPGEALTHPGKDEARA